MNLNCSSKTGTIPYHWNGLGARINWLDFEKINLSMHFRAIFRVFFSSKVLHSLPLIRAYLFVLKKQNKNLCKIKRIPWNNTSVFERERVNAKGKHRIQAMGVPHPADTQKMTETNEIGWHFDGRFS